MYGQAEYTRKCIELTRLNAGIPEQDYDILVVDDGSQEYFTHSEALVLRLKENSGYTNAQNQGILWAGERYDYVHCLNNDTEPHPDFLKHLLDEMEKDESIAIASSVRIYPKDNLVELYGLDLIRGYQCVTKPENLKDEVIECNWVPLCSALVRVDVIRELGILNKQMKNHSSDLEYCLRVKQAHYKIIVVTRSQVIHHHEVTTSANKITPEKDQRVLLEILAGLPYQQFMAKIPLDAEQGTYGRLTFEVYQKK
jgi:GT2 family glycosyltransferase